MPIDTGFRVILPALRVLFHEPSISRTYSFQISSDWTKLQQLFSSFFSLQSMTGSSIATLSALIWTWNVSHKFKYLNIGPQLGALFWEHCVTSRGWRLTRGSELLGVNLEVLHPYPAICLLSASWQEIQSHHLLQASMIDWLSLDCEQNKAPFVLVHLCQLHTT